MQSDGVRALAPVVLGRSAVARESACTAASLVPMPRWHECTHAYISNRSCETQERRSLDTDARTRSQRVFAESTAVLVWPLIAMVARTHAHTQPLISSSTNNDTLIGASIQLVLTVSSRVAAAPAFCFGITIVVRVSRSIVVRCLPPCECGSDRSVSDTHATAISKAQLRTLPIRKPINADGTRNLRLTLPSSCCSMGSSVSLLPSSSCHFVCELVAVVEADEDDAAAADTWRARSLLLR